MSVFEEVVEEEEGISALNRLRGFGLGEDDDRRSALAEGLSRGLLRQGRKSGAMSVRSTDSKRDFDVWDAMAGDDFNGPGILDSSEHAIVLAAAGTSIAQVMKDLMGREQTNRDRTTGFKGNMAGWDGYKKLLGFICMTRGIRLVRPSSSDYT